MSRTARGLALTVKLAATLVCGGRAPDGTLAGADSRDASAVVAASTPADTGRLAIIGVDYYYEVHGTGDPLLLLHGGLGSGAMFGPVLTELASQRKVVLVDLQGHGRTPLGTRPFGLEAIGDDMAVLAERLAGGPALDVMGYSLGGGVAMRTT